MPGSKSKVLIVGGGKGGEAILGIFLGIKSLEIVGIADPDREAPGIKKALSVGVPVYSDYREVLNSIEVDEVINLTGLEKVQKDLLKISPAGCEVIGGHSAKLFWDIIESHREMEKSILDQKNFLGTVIDSLPHAFLVVDAENYNIIMANKAAKEMGNITPASKCYELSHRRQSPCDGAKHVCSLGFVKMQKKMHVVQHVHFDKDGNQKYIEVHCCPIFNDKGEITQFIEYNIDVTDRKELEKKRAEKAKEMEIIYKATMGREDRVIELKQEIKDLKKKLGENK